MITCNLTGLKFLMYRHPWISMVIGIGTNFLLFSSITLLSWTRSRRTVEPVSSVSEVQELEDQNSDGLFLVKTIFVALMMIMMVISGSVY